MDPDATDSDNEGAVNFLRRMFSARPETFARAVEAGDLVKMETLLRTSPRLVNARCGPYKEPPLHRASQKGRLEAARFLLRERASVEARDALDDTALHRAAYNGHSRIVELLIQSGSAVDVKGRFDQTPLFSAAGKGHVEVAELLISRGAYVNALNSSGYTPLHFAAVSGHREMVEILMQRGADAYKRANDGVSPLDQGRLGGLRVMMEFAAKRLAAAGHDANIQAETPTATSLLKKAREASVSDDRTSAQRFYDEALSYCRAAFDTLGEGNALRGLGFLEALSGRNDEARSKYEEALALFRQGKHRAQEAHALLGLGNLTKSTATVDAAKPFFQEAAAIFESLGLPQFQEFALTEVSDVPDRAPIPKEAVAALNSLLGRYAIRVAPARGPAGRLDYSYTNLDPNSRQPSRYVRRCLLIESVEPGRIIAKRVSLASPERPEPGDVVSQILEGAEWFDGAWAPVGPDGEVLG